MVVLFSLVENENVKEKWSISYSEMAYYRPIGSIDMREILQSIVSRKSIQSRPTSYM